MSFSIILTDPFLLQKPHPPRRLFYKCIACGEVFQDRKADESDSKNAERARRAERIRDKAANDKKKGSGGDGPAEPHGGEKKPVIQTVQEDSDSDY